MGCDVTNLKNGPIFSQGLLNRSLTWGLDLQHMVVHVAATRNLMALQDKILVDKILEKSIF